MNDSLYADQYTSICKKTSKAKVATETWSSIYCKTETHYVWDRKHKVIFQHFTKVRTQINASLSTCALSPIKWRDVAELKCHKVMTSQTTLISIQNVVKILFVSFNIRKTTCTLINMSGFFLYLCLCQTMA